MTRTDDAISGAAILLALFAALTTVLRGVADRPGSALMWLTVTACTVAVACLHPAYRTGRA